MAVPSSLKSENSLLVHRREEQKVTSRRSALHKLRYSQADLTVFTRSLAVLTRARIPLVEALTAAKGQIKSSAFAASIDQVIQDVRSGKSLSISLGQHPCFGPSYIHLVRVGEASGALAPVLEQLALHLEQRSALTRKVKLALIYPGLVLAVAVAATVFLLTVIVPTFADLYADFDTDLPTPTRIVLNISSGFVEHYMHVILGVISAVCGAGWVYRTATGRYIVDKVVFNLPLYGPLLAKGTAARFCRTLGTLLKHGVGLVEALKIQTQAATNVFFKEELIAMMDTVKQGGRLTQSAQTASVLPDLVGRMISVGEETAEMDQMLLQAAEFYEQEVEDVAETLTSVLEPLLIVLIGAVLGFLLVALYLPMFDLSGLAG